MFRKYRLNIDEQRFPIIEINYKEKYFRTENSKYSFDDIGKLGVKIEEAISPLNKSYNDIFIGDKVEVTEEFYS